MLFYEVEVSGLVVLIHPRDLIYNAFDDKGFEEWYMFNVDSSPLIHMIYMLQHH